jgi:hypothetical protein
MAGLGLMKQPDDPLDIYILDLFNIRQKKIKSSPALNNACASATSPDKAKLSS